MDDRGSKSIGTFAGSCYDKNIGFTTFSFYVKVG